MVRSNMCRITLLEGSRTCWLLCIQLRLSGVCSVPGNFLALQALQLLRVFYN